MPNGSGIQYVEIGASDLYRSLDFYEDLLGFRAAAEPPVPPEPGVQWLSAGPALVKLVQVGEGNLGGWVRDDLQRGIRHFGMKVGDVEAQAERLRDAGVQFSIGPKEAVGGVRLAFFTDPDGALLEIIDGHLKYHEIWSPELADRERAAAADRPPTAGPSFDHVAVTVSDLDATLAFYRDTLGYEVIGQLHHTQDPRGFVITYLQAGGAVLEVFTFTAPTTPKPDGGSLGLREIGIGALDAAQRQLLTEPNGIPLRAVTGG